MFTYFKDAYNVLDSFYNIYCKKIKKRIEDSMSLFSYPRFFKSFHQIFENFKGKFKSKTNTLIQLFTQSLPKHKLKQFYKYGNKNCL